MKRINFSDGLASLILFFHTLFIFIFALKGEYPDLFDYILLFANFASLQLFLKGFFPDRELTLSAIFLIFCHAVLGRIVAPDDLTSGASLVVNIFVVYSALDILRSKRRFLWNCFIVSYFALFLIFIIFQRNAEPLFLASVFALAGLGRHPKLICYFWALVISFTFCQPYAWESAIIFFVILKIFFSVRGCSGSPMLEIAFLVGLGLLFLIIFPVVSVILNEDPRNIARVFSEKRFINAVAMSFITALLSTVFLVLFFTPFAYVVSRTEFKFKNFIVSLSDISIVIPESIAGIALLLVFGRQQPLGEFMWSVLNLRFDGTFFGICLAQIFISLPFYFRTALRAFESVPQNLEFTAQTLGASRIQSAFKISIPMASRGILLASLLAFGRGAGIFGAVLLIAPNPETAPMLAFNRFQSLGVHETTPLVAALLILSLILFLLVQTVGGGKQKSGTE